MRIRRYGNTYCLPYRRQKKIEGCVSELVLGARRMRARVGNEVARNQLASRQPSTSPLCIGQSHLSFVHIPSSTPAPLLGRSAVQLRSFVPLFLRGLLGCYLGFFVLIILRQEIITVLSFQIQSSNLMKYLYADLWRQWK